MKDAIIALGMGAPNSIGAIKPFLNNLFRDREIINFHIGALQTPLAALIANARAKKIAPLYMKMGLGGASPQNIYTKKLLDAIQKKYKEKSGRDVEVFGAMCYYHPFMEEAAQKIKAGCGAGGGTMLDTSAVANSDGSANTAPAVGLNGIGNGEFRRLTVFSLHPHYAAVTAGACFVKLNKVLPNLAPWAAETKIIPHWYRDSDYCACLAERIKSAAARLGKPAAECHGLFSAHSLPQYVADTGDPYTSQIQEHAKILASLSGLGSFEVTYQSKVGRAKWVGPFTNERLVTLAQTKEKDNIIVAPISFICDQIETLIELDEMLLPQVRQMGMSVERMPSLNAEDDFCDALTDILLR